MRTIKRSALGLCAGATCLALAPRARADEPVAASEPRLMSETAEVTSVVDAFDKDDPFDLNLTLGFQQSWKHSSIRRETELTQPGLSNGGFIAHTENVASYSQSTSLLNIGADIGIFHDLALILRLPVVLSNSQSLDDLNGSAGNPGRLLDTNGQSLFGGPAGSPALPFKSPSRSGLDYFSVGLDWAIFNQQRDQTKPTWVVGVEGRFSIGTPLHACNDAGVAVFNADGSSAGTRKCPDPVNPAGPDRDPGLSRAMNSVGAHTVFSRRFGYVEPYSGFWFLADFPQSNSDFAATNDLQGALVNHPPLIGTFALGLEVIPWEHREQFQRLVADFRVSGTYHSPGREYSELFDALGTSQAASLRNPNPGAYHANPDTSMGAPASVADPAAQKVYFTGITDQEAYGSIAGRFAATWQAGEYIKFVAGVGLTYAQSHLITSADSCNPSIQNDIGAAGPCKTAAAPGFTSPTGIPNPNHRDAIDLPGHRFSADDTTIVDLWLSGVVMF